MQHYGSKLNGLEFLMTMELGITGTSSGKWTNLYSIRALQKFPEMWRLGLAIFTRPVHQVSAKQKSTFPETFAIRKYTRVILMIQNSLLRG